MTGREQWWRDYWRALEAYVRIAPSFYDADACAIERANERRAIRRLTPEPAREDGDA